MEVTPGETLSNKQNTLAFQYTLEYNMAKTLYEERVSDVDRYPGWVLITKRFKVIEPIEEKITLYNGKPHSVFGIPAVLSKDIYKFRDRVNEITDKIDTIVSTEFYVGLNTKMDLRATKDGLGTIELKGATCSYKVLKSEDQVQSTIRRILKNDIESYYFKWLSKHRSSVNGYVVPQSRILPKKLLDLFLDENADWDKLSAELFETRLKADTNLKNKKGG